jgi:hypothetical protein
LINGGHTRSEHVADGFVLFFVQIHGARIVKGEIIDRRFVLLLNLEERRDAQCRMIFSLLRRLFL